VEGERLAAPRASLMEVDFEEARAFGSDPGITGISGETPARGRTVVTDQLAGTLEVGKGDTVEAFVYGKRIELTVDRVVPAKGVAGFGLGFFDEPAHNLFVAPGTINDLTRGVQADLGGRLVPPDWAVAVSNVGGVEDGAEVTEQVSRRLGNALDGLGLNVNEVKQDILTEADDAAASFQEIFSAMGAFGVLAGVLLLVNIFVMLGEERKPELGMIRAVGMRRISLVGGFSTEGWLYALAASIVGTFVGVGLGRLIIEGVERIFENDVEGFGLATLRFAADPSSLQQGMAAGFVIALVAVVLTSIRIARFNVIRAIRDLPEPRRARARLRWAVAGAVLVVFGGMMTVAGFVGEEAHMVRQVGPPVLVLGAALLAARIASRRAVVSGASVLVLLWSAVIFPLTSGLGEAGIQVFVVQGILLTTAAVVLVTQEHDRFERLARRLGVGRLAMAMRLGLAYPIARRFRTGLTLAMYSLVIFTLTFISVLSATFSNQIDTTTREISGGYDLYVRFNPSNPVPAEELASVDGVTGVAPIATLPVRVFPDGVDKPTDWGVTGIDERFLEHGAPELADRGDYPSDEAAYRAVMADPDLVLVDQFFLQEGGGPPDAVVRIGDQVTLVNPETGEERQVTVAARAADDFLFNGALYGMEGLRELYGPRAIENRAYVAVADAADPHAVAARIAGSYIEEGAKADTIRDLLADFIAIQNQFFQLFEGYLGLGLLVGIAGLGVVMVRAVRERRREIGVLRALGFQSQTVRRSFIFESAFIALEGTIIGLGLGLVTAYNVMSNTDAFGEGANFTVSPGTLALVLVGTLLASLLATAAPTRAAARIRPAVALRIAD
ncbi:MAG TPA: FtsX-like permease family protein, partial [Acidimicrobiia bacterium]|nr:FtsX-like permease family protein [Acidimicrobiia bacterium]